MCCRKCGIYWCWTNEREKEEDVFPHGSFPQGSGGVDSKTKRTEKKSPSRLRKSYQRSVLHRAALAAPSLPPAKNGSLRQAALTSVQRLQTVAALPVINQSTKKRPLPDSPNGPSPLDLPPLAQRIRKDIQLGESEVESPEKEVLRSPPFPENSPAPLSPCSKSIPSPTHLVFTPMQCPRKMLNMWKMKVMWKSVKMKIIWKSVKKRRRGETNRFVSSPRQIVEKPEGPKSNWGVWGV